MKRSWFRWGWDIAWDCPGNQLHLQPIGKKRVGLYLNSAVTAPNTSQVQWLSLSINGTSWCCCFLFFCSNVGTSVFLFWGFSFEPKLLLTAMFSPKCRHTFPSVKQIEPVYIPGQRTVVIVFNDKKRKKSHSMFSPFWFSSHHFCLWFSESNSHPERK